MKQKTSFFNAGIAKNLLRRCWPLWTAYLAVLLLIIPTPLLSLLHNSNGYYGDVPPLNINLANMGEATLVISLAAGALTAMAMFGYLYGSRSCGMMNALPVTRTAMFCTVFLTGLLPLLAADLLTAALTALLCASGYLEPSIVLAWLAAAVFTNIFYYGFAVFCAMLTGNILVLPAVYLVLLFTAFVAEDGASTLLRQVIYGLPGNVGRLSWLSPPVYMLKHYRAEIVEWPRVVRITGLGVMAAYAAAGLVFTLLAWRLYLRRRMETATDTVAIPVLKGVFKYCMCFGTAIVFAAAVSSLLTLGKGGKLTLLLLVLLLIGAFIGYFVAEMLIRKTVCVFRGNGRGYLICACILIVLVAACEFDLLGYERRVPDASEVEWVCVNGSELREEKNIEQTLALHRGVIDNKVWHEQTCIAGSAYWGSDELWGACQNLLVDYRLKNGRTISRIYTVYGDQDSTRDPNSDLARLQDLLNTQEALEYRFTPWIALTARNVEYAEIQFTDYNAQQGYHESADIPLSGEELIAFWNEAILPDLAEGKIGRMSLWPESGDWQETNTHVCFQLVSENFRQRGGGIYNSELQWFDFVVTTDDSHCLDWIEARTGQRPRVLEQDGEQAGA